MYIFTTTTTILYSCYYTCTVHSYSYYRLILGERLLDSGGQDKQEVKTNTTSVNGSASIGGGLTSTFTIRKEVDYATAAIWTLCVLVGGGRGLLAKHSHIRLLISDQ